ADDHAQFWKPIEDAARDEAQEVQPGLDAKAENCALETRIEQRSDELTGRCVGMQVDRHIEAFSRLEYLPGAGVVQILIACMGVDDGPFQSQLLHTASQLAGCLGRILRGYC